jgi:hypothetical protein
MANTVEEVIDCILEGVNTFKSDAMHILVSCTEDIEEKTVRRFNLGSAGILKCDARFGDLAGFTWATCPSTMYQFDKTV